MTRATAFGNRTISGQRRDLQSGGDAESEEDDNSDGMEMAAMAKVWAHPEDLHKYPVRALPLSTRPCLRVDSALLHASGTSAETLL